MKIRLNQAELERLWETFIKERDPRAREQLILAYVCLVKYLAGRLSLYFCGRFELDDLVAAGIPGLIRAVDSYDPERGVKFETFATIKIRGAIIDWARSFSWVPRSVYAEARRVEEAMAHLAGVLGRSPEDQEVAAYLHLTDDQYRQLLERITPVTLVSLDGVSEGEVPDSTLLSGYGTEQVLEGIERKETVRELAEAIGQLPEREQLMLSLYYQEGLTLKEIGRVLGVSESRVAQLHTRAILKLRKHLKVATPAASGHGGSGASGKRRQVAANCHK